MKQSNIDVLEKHYHHWLTLKNAGYLRGLNVNEKTELLNVMIAEFSPKYNTDLWCGNCVANMVKDLYQRYDKYKAKQNLKITCAVVIDESALYPANSLPRYDAPPPPGNTSQDIRVNAKTDAIDCTALTAPLDFVKTLPALQALKREGLVFVIDENVKGLADLARLNYFVSTEEKYKPWLNVIQVITPGGESSDRAEIFIKPVNVETFDYVLDFKPIKGLTVGKIVQLIKAFPFNTFGVIEPIASEIEELNNVKSITGLSVNELANVLIKSKYGLIATPGATAYLAYYANVKVMLLTQDVVNIDVNTCNDFTLTSLKNFITV